MFKLIIEDDEGKTTVVPLIRDGITIGRKEGNTIRLTERNVSRRHAKLVKQNSSVYIEDLGSYNGIKVNGNKITGRIAVSEGDRIQIGDYLLALKMDRAVAAAGRAADPFGEVKTLPLERPPDEAMTPGAEAARAGGGNGVEAAGAPAPAGAASAEALPDAALDVAPTTPVSTQADLPARLVVLSSNFAGQEFLLDKAKLVIGRVDDNDIVVNHRSISRHHAAIVREHGRYNIVDLQSANGVRVNGEEYGKVVLRRGDIIDLGHVRLRFVEPGEDFVFDRDATVTDISPGGWRAISPAMGVFVALVALSLVAFIFRDRLFGHGGTGAGPPDAQIAAAPLGTPSGPSELEIDRALSHVTQLINEERWDDAIRECDQVLKARPDYEMARERKQRAEAGMKNQEVFARYTKSSANRDWDPAVEAFNAITEDSPYKERARKDWDEVRRSYVREHHTLANRAVQAGKCDEAKREADKVKIEDDSNTRVVEIVKSCGKPQAVAE